MVSLKPGGSWAGNIGKSAALCGSERCNLPGGFSVKCMGAGQTGWRTVCYSHAVFVSDAGGKGSLAWGAGWMDCGGTGCFCRSTSRKSAGGPSFKKHNLLFVLYFSGGSVCGQGSGGMSF